MSRRTIIIVIAASIVILAVALVSFIVLGERLFKQIVGTTTTTKVQAQARTLCPLTGQQLSFSKERPPFAVCINNIRQARPQSGLNRADIVYEVLAEAGIPRLLAIYKCKDARRIGPVRSARTYFIDLAKQFDAVLIHAGGSPQALREIKQGKIRSLDQFRFPDAYFRDPTRRAPHNLFTNTSRLAKAADDAGFFGPSDTQGLAFGKVKIEGGNAQTITISFPTTRVTYRYDPSTDTYFRFMNGQPHVDAAAGRQLQAKNVIVQFAEHRVIDRVGRLDIKLTGEGRAIFFIGGKRVGGRWVRQSEMQTFKYEDSMGNEFKLRPGQTWVEIVSEDVRIYILDGHLKILVI
ncbi:MAG: DUF3048 domain-containing protein [Actinomycetota bacterium]